MYTLKKSVFDGEYKGSIEYGNYKDKAFIFMIENDSMQLTAVITDEIAIDIMAELKTFMISAKENQ